MNRLVRLHVWLGLTCGGLLSVVSISGVLLLYSGEIEGRLHPHLFNVQVENGRTSLDETLVSVRREFPDAKIKSFHFSQEPDRPHMLWLRDESDQVFKRVFVNPHSGRVLGSLAKPESVHRWLNNLHYKFFSGLPGTLFVFVLGLALLASCVTGAIVYRRRHRTLWPNPIRWHESNRIWLADLHDLVGLATLVTNSLLVGTGIWVAMQEVSAILSLPGPEIIEFPVSPWSTDHLVRQANETLPALEPRSIRYPETAGQPICVQGRLSGHPFLQGAVCFSFEHGTKLETLDDRNGNLVLWLSRFADPIHAARFGGIGVKAMYTILGLAPAFLSLSGAILWWRAPLASTRSRE